MWNAGWGKRGRRQRDDGRIFSVLHEMAEEETHLVHRQIWKNGRIGSVYDRQHSCPGTQDLSCLSELLLLYFWLTFKVVNIVHDAVTSVRCTDSSVRTCLSASTSVCRFICPHLCLSTGASVHTPQIQVDIFGCYLYISANYETMSCHVPWRLRV